MWWLKSIKRILKSIASTHKQKLTHSGMDRHSSYVIQDGELKLLNIKSQNATMSEASMKDDFIQFRDFLRERLPKTWRGLNLFLDFFDKPIEFESYVEKLIRHPFLMSSQNRLKYFFRIDQAFEQNIISQHHFGKSFKDGHFSGYMGWNSTRMYNRMSQDLKATIDYGKSHWITYEGHLLVTLVMFLRNVYVHRANSGNYELLDKEVNRLYPGFLSNLHELLPSNEELNRPTIQMEAEGEAGQGPSLRLLQG
ncbi:uncharacterized protein LOC125479814 [Pyrus x bretschneideri]|uniref:uncharacterized protein LOC125479814 n=1 Tax=Pyrus x bretschneideri TaxID=225117 RepID=UPI00202FB344|nr:uncharacterized protein LOC125479814 [Pyrus x bretschneideri]